MPPLHGDEWGEQRLPEAPAQWEGASQPPCLIPGSPKSPQALSGKTAPCPGLQKQNKTQRLASAAQLVPQATRADISPVVRTEGPCF